MRIRFTTRYIDEHGTGFSPGREIEGDDVAKYVDRGVAVEVKPEPKKAPATSSVPAAIANLKVPELREFCKEKGIELGDATKKAEILELVAAALGSGG